MSRMRTNRGWLRLTAAAAIVATTAIGAQAGECPAGASKPNARQPVDFKPVGVTDTTLGAIDLGKEMTKIKGRELRFRKMVIQPGASCRGTAANRPALISSPKARSSNTPATAPRRSITRLARSAPSERAPRTGGKT